MINKLLSTAVKLYLRSQVSQAENLQVKIGGKKRQILQGYIPEVFLSCAKGIYQGLHLRQIELKGTDIAINLPEVLKKKPLRLLEPIVIDIALTLDSGDLLASINSPLLQSGLTDLWQIILQAKTATFPLANLDNSSIQWSDIAIANQKLILRGTYIDQADISQELNISTGLSLVDSHTLCLFPLKVVHNLQQIENLPETLEINLGQQVYIQELLVESEQILCTGKITVNN